MGDVGYCTTKTPHLSSAVLRDALVGCTGVCTHRGQIPEAFLILLVASSGSEGFLQGLSVSAGPRAPSTCSSQGSWEQKDVNQPLTCSSGYMEALWVPTRQRAQSSNLLPCSGGSGLEGGEERT